MVYWRDLGRGGGTTRDRGRVDTKADALTEGARSGSKEDHVPGGASRRRCGDRRESYRISRTPNKARGRPYIHPRYPTHVQGAASGPLNGDRRGSGSKTKVRALGIPGPRCGGDSPAGVDPLLARRGSYLRLGDWGPRSGELPQTGRVGTAAGEEAWRELERAPGWDQGALATRRRPKYSKVLTPRPCGGPTSLGGPPRGSAKN